MSWLGRWLTALRSKSELQEELESHLNLAIADRVARGESPEAARRSALREFGNVPLVADVTRERWGWLRLEHLAQDLKYAMHQLRKSPGFAVTAVLVLTLGIGANLAIFSLIYAIMLRSLPVPHPEQIVQLKMRTDGVSSMDSQVTSMYNVLAARQKPLQGMCGLMWDGVLLTGSGEPEQVSTANVTGDCFATLEIVPTLGRLIAQADDVEGGGPAGYATVLSYDYWNLHFHRDPSVIGRRLAVRNIFSKATPLIIVGVLPDGFHGLVPGSSPSFYLPSYFEGKVNRDSNGNRSMLVFGRLRPGISRRQAEEQLQPAFTAWRDSIPPADRGDLKTGIKRADLGVFEARAGGSQMAGAYGKELWFLQLLVGMILIAGCVYLSTLLSARIAGRRHELAVRVALGASRSRITMQLLIETLLLIGAGAVAGIFLGWSSARVLVTYITHGGAGSRLDLSPDLTMLGFAACVACVATLLTGVLPAIRGSKTDLIGDLKIGKGNTGSGRFRGRLGVLMLPLQIAFSVVFVVIAGLLSASLVRALTQHNGFRMSGTIFAQTTIPAVISNDGDKVEVKLRAQLAQYRNLVDRLNQAPGISSASLSVLRPLAGTTYSNAYKAVGGKGTSNDQMLINWVAPHYFDVAGTHLLRGRDFSGEDRHSSQQVCILSASAARHFFPDGNAIGGRLDGGSSDDIVTVVGVVEDTRWNSLQTEMPRMIYFPVDQMDGFLRSLQFVLRAADSETALASLRQILREDAGAQVVDVMTIHDAVNQSLSMPRLLATLSNALAGLALLLSAVAIYGLLSYSVKQRTAEIAVRMAVGASQADVIRMIARQAAWLILPGLAVGAAVAIGLSRVFKSLLYATSPADPVALSLSLAVLLLVAVVAALLPARRAASVDPMVALRTE